jgi:hypothetical protein
MASMPSDEHPGLASRFDMQDAHKSSDRPFAGAVGRHVGRGDLGQHGSDHYERAILLLVEDLQ